MNWLLKFITGGGASAVNETANTVGGFFGVNKEAQAKRDSDYNQSVVEQYAAEFHQRTNRTWFDALADGMNRLIRPTITIILMSVVPVAFIWPQTVDVAFITLAYLPDAYWALLSLVVAFYFGGRMQLKSQDFRRGTTIVQALASVRNTPSENNTSQTGDTKTVLLNDAYLSDDGQRLEGLGIVYRGDDSLPYGVTATRRAKTFEGIIDHHPAAAPGTSVHNLIEYINTPRPPNGYMFGYHFMFDNDDDATVYQCAPLNMRTNHVQGSKHRNDVAPHLTNANTIGFSFHLASHRPGMAPTEAQMAKAKLVSEALEKVYGVKLPHYGHGEIQTNKQKNEGKVFAEFMRRG